MGAPIVTSRDVLQAFLALALACLEVEVRDERERVEAAEAGLVKAAEALRARRR